MGRPRTPTAVLEAKGAFRKDPQRAVGRLNEPKPSGEIGKPPRHFDRDHRRVWKEIVSEAPRGVLTRSDRKHLELTVRLQCKANSIPGRLSDALEFLGKALIELGMDEDRVTDFQEDMEKLIGCSTQEATLLKACYGSMGMNPADRSKVQVEPEEKEPDGFDAILGAFGVAKHVQ